MLEPERKRPSVLAASLRDNEKRGERGAGAVKSKTFFLAALSCALLLLSCAAGLVAWTDPLLTVGTLEEGGTALFINERYELAGLIRRQDYSSVVMGTSSVANFRASWFTQGTGKKTLKITFPDGRLSEFDTALDLAFRTHGELDTVYFCLDPTVLIREEQVSELPEYLYNDNPVDDVEFYLNAESVALAAKSLAWREQGRVSLDDAYVWEDGHEFSWRAALENYERPEDAGGQLPADTYLAAAERNMDVVCRWMEEHPNTRFVVWYPPYSILFWDKMLREGKADAVMEAVKHATLRMMDYDNAEVHCFLHALEYISELGNYTDHIHCSAAITSWEADMLMHSDRWRLTREDYSWRLDELQNYFKEYNFQMLFGA